MDTCRSAGEQLADPNKYPSLPAGALPDQAAKSKLVTDVENHITQAIVISPSQIRVVAYVVRVVRANTQLNALAEASLPGQPTNVAAGMAMRYYAGLLDMAKSLRYDENTAGGGKKVIDEAMRAGYMVIVHGKAVKDEIYAAGARFGWWGIKRPDRKVKEDVFDNGITDFYKQLYLTDYYQQYPPLGGLVDNGPGQIAKRPGTGGAAFVLGVFSRCQFEDVEPLRGGKRPAVGRIAGGRADRRVLPWRSVCARRRRCRCRS